MKKKKKRSVRSIALCSSAGFFRELLKIGEALKERGFRVHFPLTAVK